MSFAATAFGSTLFSRFTRPFSTSFPSFSLSDSAARGTNTMSEKATLAAGCFWGVEHLFRKEFGNGKGLLDSSVGYCGGTTPSPTYRAVCSEQTGHAEALQVTFDPSIVTYRQLIEFFYRMHDPTTKNRQGPDVGTSYRSAIFTHSDEQNKIAREITDKVSTQWFKQPVTTEILALEKWWDAEDYHQLYLHKNPSGYECPSHFVRSFPPLTD